MVAYPILKPLYNLIAYNFITMRVSVNRMVLVFYLFYDALAMFHKRQGPDRSSQEDQKRFKRNIDDLFLNNDISATRAQSLYADGAACKLGRDWDKRAKIGNSGSTTKHIHRDLVQQLVRYGHWPDFYFAPIRMWCPRSATIKVVNLPFLLPHELIYAIAQVSDENAMFDKTGLCQSTKNHMQAASVELGCDLISLGLWGDGTPCNWDRSQSIETFSLNFPGLVGSGGQLRVPMTAVNKKFMNKDVTCDDIMSILCWSFKCLATGLMPSVGHLGQPLTGKRMKKAGKAVPKAVLAEVRSDWAWLKQTFRFPQHNEKDGICWQCPATPADVRSCAHNADWKRNRLSHFDMAKRMMEKGLVMSPLFSSPCFRISCFLVDWLHCADLGVTSDFLAGFFLLVCTKLPGASLASRVNSLWLSMQEFYKRTNVTSRLDMLKVSMLKQPKKTPKLRAKAAEARGLVPFGLEVARLLDDTIVLENTAKAAMEHLSQCYNLLSPEIFSADMMGFHSQRFCLLYVALEQALPQQFHIKPKLHMFQELTQMSRSCPSLFWTYRDEEFGGTVAQLSRRRGGSNNPAATAISLLSKFKANNNVPCIV